MESAGPGSHGSAPSEAPANGSPRRPKMDTWFSSRMHVCIKLVEARNLRGFDATTQSSDPFAKLRLSAPGESTPAHEYRTRTIYRNLNPMFSESLICPLSTLKPDFIFELKMYDADWLRNEAMGHVKSTLGDLLRPLETESPNLVWMNLTRKHGSLWRKPEGEVLLEVAVLPPEQAGKALAAQKEFRQQESAARYQDYQLEVMLHGLSFRGAMTASAIAGFTKSLLVEVRFGQSSVVHRVNGKIVEEEDHIEAFDVEFGDVIRLPLEAAFQASQSQYASAIQRAGITGDRTDVRIILHNEGNLISKTQVPLSCFPWAGDLSKPSRGASPESTQHTAKSNLGSRASSVSSALRFADTGSTVPKQEGEPENSPTTFVRTMEPLARRSPFAAATIEFSAALVKKAATPLSTASISEDTDEPKDVKVLDMLEDQEDMRDAPPLEDIPPPLDFPCLDMEFGFGPCRLYQMLIKKASKINGKIAAIEGLTNMQAGPWELVDTDKGKVRQRRLTYRKPVNVPVPFAPKFCDMTAIQTIVRKEVSGWILTIENYTNAPMGDTFKVLIQTLGTRGKTSGSSVLRVSMQVEFLKNPGMLRSVILSQAQKEAIEHWALVKKYIKEAFDEEEAGQTEPSLATQSREPPTALEPVPAPVVEAQKPSVLQLLSWQTVVLLLGLLLLALLVLAVHEHAQAVRALSASIAELAAVHVHQALPAQQQEHPQ